MRKMFLLISAVVLTVALAGCIGYSEEHMALPLAPPTAPVDFPAPTPRPTPTPRPASDFPGITAAELVSNIRVGWVLGNTLDAHDDRRMSTMTVTQMETFWRSHITNRDNINLIRDSGFNAIRIPVTWHKATDREFNIREDWMARVMEVVDYAVAADMYIVLNSHHDEFFFRLMDDEMEASKYAFERIWTQIAEAFRDYDFNLIFQGLNEPRTRGSAAEWSGGTAEERNNLNILNQLFVDTVRATGGNNAYRVLMIPTYAASANALALRGLVMPEDSVPGRIIVTVHIYEPWNFALRTAETGVTPYWSRDNDADVRGVTRLIDQVYEILVSQGIPVVITEMGAINRDNTEARAEWAEFYVAHARSRGIPCFWWDNYRHTVVERLTWGWTQPFGLLDRANNVIVFPEIVEALMRGTQ